MSKKNTGPDGLTDYQKKFIEEYLKDLNQTQAAIRAGYRGKESTARISASRMMRDVNVKREIDKRIEERSKRNEITADRVLQELAAIAFFDVRKIYNEKNEMKKITDLDDRTARAISSIETEVSNLGHKVFSTTKKIRMNDKIRALQLVGNHIGMFKESTSSTEDVVNALKDIAQNLPG